MGLNNENNDWKKEAPLLAGLPANNPFSVPDGYFEGLGNQISNAIYLEGLKTEVKKTGFDIPENYFGELTEKINAAVFIEKLKSGSTNDGFEVPANYFDQLHSNILSKTLEAQPQKLSQTTVFRLWHSKLLKYASAACFVIVAGIGTLYFNQQDTTQYNTTEMITEQMLFDIEEEMIIEHIEAHQAKQPKASAQDLALENYILNNYSQQDLVTGL